MNRDRLVAFLLLCFCVAYGYLAGGIELYPGSEEEAFNARTFPTALAWTGGIVAILMLVFSSQDSERKTVWSGFDWTRVALLCVLMVGYGLTIKNVSFFLSTVVFLGLGFLLLGERNWKILGTVPILVAASFQFLLHSVLDIYIADPLLQAVGIIQ